MNFIKTEITEAINELRVKLYQKLTSPMDAMWELLYIESSQHYLIQNNNRTMGYCCVNDADCLIQLFLEEEYYSAVDGVIEQLIKTKLINAASLSSKESMAFNACLMHSKSTKVNTFCFQHSNRAIELDGPLKIDLVTSEDIPAVKVFLKDQIGMDDIFGYTENLVSRKELFLVKESGLIIASSECRISDSQPAIADIGIIVHKDFHGKGIATQVMQRQVNRVLKAGRKPICSTTLDNVASRKLIEKSGFYCSNIIFDIKF